MKQSHILPLLGASLLALAACSSDVQPSADAAMDGMDHSMHAEVDHMAMSMDDMAAMLEGKTGDELDKAFLEGMIPHHQGAIEMARALLEGTEREEMKDLARDIIQAQQQEIDMMKRWQRDWGFTE